MAAPASPAEARRAGCRCRCRRCRSRRARSTSRRARSWCRSAPCSRAGRARPRSARASSSPRRPHRHQLPRRQRGRAQARAARPGLRHRRRPRGAAADPAARRAARPRAAARRRRRRQRSFDALPFRAGERAAGAGRAHLLARQPARRRLRGHRRHLQRPGQAQLLSADLLRRRALGRHERRPGARRGGPRRRHQRRAPRRRRAGQLPGAGEFAIALLARGKDAAPLLGAGLRDRRRATAGAPGGAHRSLHRPGLEERDPSALPRAGAARRVHALLGHERRRRAPAASTSSAPTA